MKENMLFTAGKFARLCDITKDTLYHYEEIGILKPEVVKPNGYRYYSAKQFFDYDLIATLKYTGSSLAEIKSYMEQKNPQTFLNMLVEKEVQIEKERKKLERTSETLKAAISATRYALQEPYETPRLHELEEEHLITLALPSSGQYSLSREVFDLQDHYDYCDKYFENYSYTMGAIIPAHSIANQSFTPSHYFSATPDSLITERVVIKPAGTYLTWLYKGNYFDTEDTYLRSIAKAKEMGFYPNGAAYEYDLINHVATGNLHQYVIRIDMQVEQKCNDAKKPRQ